jgi:4a-hydroxytetrahydrobiopterin dehydratase
MSVLQPDQLSDALEQLGGWDAGSGALRKRYEFDDFAGAMAFANRVAGVAEEADHHPDLLVTWGACEVAWVSHSAGGITGADVAMARRTDELAQTA